MSTAFPAFCNVVCIYLHIPCPAAGEFGQVFKGIWAHMIADGNKVSEVVAVKTIKSTVDYNTKHIWGRTLCEFCGFYIANCEVWSLPYLSFRGKTIKSLSLAICTYKIKSVSFSTFLKFTPRISCHVMVCVWC